ncbi:MAG: isoleucine--tRNA ligase [Muribaculaceae bacterium]|nr:isoleucine--tRNA ligase [Muribaculaceae bacterium]
MKKFNERSGQNLSELNKEMLARWEAERLFEQSVSLREGAPSFVFYEGPPSANGMPGIHHVMARTIKDLFCRYKTMQGFQVQRKAGWDTHGLPVELGVEKSLGITKEDIGSKISVADYNAACRREVMKYTREWETLTNIMGYWVDTTDPYITYDNRYIETVWWLLSRLYSKGLLYKGYTIQPYSPGAGTGLSSHELNQPGCYRDVKDLTATVLFTITDPKPGMTGWGRPCFMAWTTTPWTLPSNTALCVGPKIDYVAVQTFNPYNGEKITVVMAESLVGSYFKKEGENADFDQFKVGDKVVPYRIAGRYTGPELVGMHYEQLMPWVKPCEKLGELATEYAKAYAAEHPEKIFSVGKDKFVELADAAFRVIPGDYVTTDDGTGIVHIAPTFGADDAKVAKAADIPSLFMVNLRGETRPMVDLQGKFYLLDELAPAFVDMCVDKELYSKYAGEYVKNAYDPQYNRPDGSYDEEKCLKAEDLNVRLCVELKASGLAFRTEKHVHNYPHCWRTDRPVIYYPLDSWFIRSTAARDRMIEFNNQIQWKPASTGSGRFGKWLENLQDWNLSRSRYWGTPLPIWRNEDGTEEICIDSVETLYNEIDKAVAAGIMTSNPLRDRGFVPGQYNKENYDKIDLHRPYVDDIVLVSPSGKPMHRETDLIDVWFDSGSMPYAQLHYPFENKEGLDSGRLFPADFIAEGVDQTRGWFFTLHAIGTMAFDHPAFKTVISNGLVLDKNGEKMSKRKGNSVDPFNTIEESGADPLRWYMISTSSPWDNLKYDPEGVKETARKFFSTLTNTYNFFAMYANVDNFDPAAEQVPLAERPEIDRWILSLLNTLVKTVTDEFDAYEPTRAARAISTFVLDNLSNWYVRLNRKRFWGGGLNRDKLAAYQTLYTCLLTVSKLMAPVAPFYADRLYRDLTQGDDSVHLAKFPVCDTSAVDEALERRMDIAQRLTSLVLSLRKKANIKVRQPLVKMLVPANDSELEAALLSVAETVKTEVNVKALEIVGADNEVFVKRVQPDFKKLGPKFGKLMKAAAERIKGLDRSEISRLERDGYIDLDFDGKTTRVDLDDVKIISEDIEGWLVANDGDLTVALDIDITPDLFREGLARDIVNRIQRLRKDRDYDITDHITLTLLPGENVAEVVDQYGEYIAGQLLADKITVAEAAPGDEVVGLVIDDLRLGAVVNKA